MQTICIFTSFVNYFIQGYDMNTLHTLNNRVNANKAKIVDLRTKNIDIVNEAITMVNAKIEEFKTIYDVTERKAIATIQKDMFVAKNKEDKLTNEIKKAIKVVVLAHKRKVFDSILWEDMSVTKIEEVLNHLTVKEIKSITNIDDIKPLLDAHKTRKVTSLGYAKAVKK